ncbi:MAG: prepilin-type N-terminal cleavage/methylation domain-containing protein [Acidobacteria bacterium]|nr:prepilin-type N-terminal cleavage/methylation domain-containing protein [Acidobacteriota bacterium]
MPKRAPQQGFSLVELMVAVLFTGILMAGMAQVYKSSLSSFQTTAEKIGSNRRGRVAIDMLVDDLNSAGMYLWDLNRYPAAITPANPGFWINPDVPVALTDGTVTGDQLLFYYDEPLPFEGKLSQPAASAKIAGVAELEAAGTAITSGAVSFTIDTGNDSFASMVKSGQRLIIKDGWPGFEIKTATVSGQLVTIEPAENYQDSTGTPTGGNWISKDRHRNDSPVTFMKTAQMVRYGIQSRQLDPAEPGRSVPCLVREQGAYQPGGFSSPTETQVLAEDVSGIQVFLSVDGGATWLRSAAGGGWDGYKTLVAAALGAGKHGRTGFTTLDDPNWYRDIPVLVRVDVKTRTTTKRSEYASTPTALAYREQTQSLVIRPRHFGLSFR